jgi:capsular polysaccharide biosynthesis protein
VWRDGVVLSADGESLARDVAPDFGRGEDGHWLVGSGKKLRAPEILPSGPVAVVAANLGSGYCHWLLDELPRLLALRAMLGGGMREMAGYVAHAGVEYARVAHARLGIAEKILASGWATHRACGPLVVPSYVGRPGFARPETVAWLREFAEDAGLGRGVAGRGERIYVSREASRRRRVVGEASLRVMLEARGFATVRLEDLGWAEQIAIFRQAKVVVAPHGAGLANLVFADRGAQVVELFGRDYVNPCFRRVAALTGLEYRGVIAAGGGEPREDRSAGGRDIAVDVTAVVAALGG